jgi:hypothetical protein
MNINLMGKGQDTHAVIEQGNHAVRVHAFADVLKGIQNGDDERVRLTNS